jgi:hypothetical protein
LSEQSFFLLSREVGLLYCPVGCGFGLTRLFLDLASFFLSLTRLLLYLFELLASLFYLLRELGR